MSEITELWTWIRLSRMDSPIIYCLQTFDILYFTPCHALLPRLDAPIPLFLGWASASDHFTFQYSQLCPTSPAQYTRQMQVISGNTIYTSHPLPDHYPLVYLTIFAHPCTIILCPLHNCYPIIARNSLHRPPDLSLRTTSRPLLLPLPRGPVHLYRVL